MFDFATILKIAQGAGNAIPTLTALFDKVVSTFGEDDQEKLRSAYRDARAASDDAHADLQDKLARAAKR